jgi:serine/threonine-protein kinase
VGSALYEHVLLGSSRIREVRFVLFDEETRGLFVELLEEMFLGEVDLGDAGEAPTREDPTAEETVLLPFSARRSSY